MGHFYQPPPPFVGGRQPHAPAELAPAIDAVPVNNPPFGVFPLASPETYSAILSAWQLAPAWVQPPKGLPQGAAAAPSNPPPYSAAQLLAQIAGMWQPGANDSQWRKLAPAITAVAVNNPPFGRFETVAPELWLTIRQSWEPGPPAQTFYPKQIVSVDNPPLGMATQVAPEIYAGIVAQWTPVPNDSQWRKLAPQITAVRVDAPPFGMFPNTSPETWGALVGSWQPGAPWPFPPRYLPQGGAVAAVNNPPPYSTAQLLAQLSGMWQPGPPLPWQGYRTQIVSVDQPPPRRLDALATQIAQAWQPGPPDQVFYPRQIVSVDNPPPLSPGAWLVLRQAWESGPPTPTAYPRFTGGAVAGTNNPPPRSAAALAAQIALSWQPDQTLPQTYPARLVQGARVDSPPFGMPPLMGRAVYQAWAPGEPLRPRYTLIIQQGLVPTGTPWLDPRYEAGPDTRDWSNADPARDLGN